MELEYGVKIENKFSFPEFDDEDILDPSEILKRLQTSEEKTVSVKQTKLLPAKKTSLPSSKSRTLTEKINPDRSRMPRSNLINKENDRTKTDERGDAVRRFPRGAGTGQPRGAQRNRLPRQERSQVPPRFRQGNDNEFGAQDNDRSRDAFQTNNSSFGWNQNEAFGTGFGQSPNFDSGDVTEPTKDRQNDVGSGFGGFGSFGAEFGGGRGNRGRGFGGRGSRFNRGGRQFDRHSGSDRTGVKPVDKRDGHGAHNWGSTADADAEAEVAERMDATVEAEDRGETEAGADAEIGKEVIAPQEPAEQEPVQLTLDEWKAQQGARQAPQFNVRRPGEGDKNPVWDKLRPLRKAGEGVKKGKGSKAKKEQVVVEDDEEDVEYEEDSRIVPIDIRFIGEPLRRGGRGRGGGVGRGFSTGPNRGFGGRGGRDQIDLGATPQSTPSKQKPVVAEETPYVIDDSSFPSLTGAH